jgi:hypothetical protein
MPGVPTQICLSSPDMLLSIRVARVFKVWWPENGRSAFYGSLLWICLCLLHKHSTMTVTATIEKMPAKILVATVDHPTVFFSPSCQ